MTEANDIVAQLDALAETGGRDFMLALTSSWPALRAELLAARESIDTLFDAVAHGDVEHRSWLKAEISRHFEGVPKQPEVT